MGNSSTKEQRHPEAGPQGQRPLYSRSTSAVHLGGGGGGGEPRHAQTGQSSQQQQQYHPRSERSGRADFRFIGLSGGPADPDAFLPEHRRETKQERDARRTERERAARLRERERSLKEEGVDGGYLVTLGVYTGPEDFNKDVVRQLMVERKLAPFWRGLDDDPSDWKDDKVIAAARAEQTPKESATTTTTTTTTSSPSATQSMTDSTLAGTSTQDVNHLTVPISSRSQSYNAESSSGTPGNASPGLVSSLPSSPSPLTANSSSSPFKPRSKTLATLTNLSKGVTGSGDMKPREVQLPKEPYLEGRPFELALYREPGECPICFLYYPPYLNRTRCCDQPICSECFVQIKRPDPHPPEHLDPTANPDVSIEDRERAAENLISEPAACPFCVQPEFGVTYDSPSFRRGLVHAQAGLGSGSNSASASTASLHSSSQPSKPGRRRGTSVSATAPGVITTDRIRPDWAQKLSSARAHAARRSAAATALHTAAYLMNNAGDGRGGFGFRRRTRGLGQPGHGTDTPSSGSRTPRSEAPTLGQISAMTSTADQRQRDGNDSPVSHGYRGASSHQPGTRLEDLEEMMMMEAIRLSLAAEEDRKKKEGKEAKKSAKKQEKDAKKAGRRQSNFLGMASGSGSGSNSGSGSSEEPIVNTDDTAASKGKGVALEQNTEPFPAMSDTPTSGSSSKTPENSQWSAEEYLRLSRAKLQEDKSVANPGQAQESELTSSTAPPPNTETSDSVDSDLAAQSTPGQETRRGTTVTERGLDTATSQSTDLTANINPTSHES